LLTGLQNEQDLNPKPETRNPKPETQNSKLETQNSKLVPTVQTQTSPEPLALEVRLRTTQIRERLVRSLFL